MFNIYIFYYFYLLAFSFLLHASGTTAIYCFQCNSLYDPDCANIQPNDTSSAHYKLCEIPEESYGNEIFCRKTVQKIHDRDGMVRVIRKCGWIMHQRDCYMVSNRGHQDTNCQCFHDGCNSANPIYFKTSNILFLSIATVLYIMK